MDQTQHAVCVHCNATNRIPVQTAGKEINCGRCHQPLLGAPPQSVDAAGFAAQVSKSDLPVVVDFWAPWCGPCKMMAPAYAQVGQALGNRARFIKVNTDDEQQLGSQHNIRSIPTLAVFKGGREVARMAGALPASELQRWVEAALAR